MDAESDPAMLTDSELLERYLFTSSEQRRRILEVRQGEADFLADGSAESLARLRDARQALCSNKEGDRYEIEVRRRLNAPIKSARLATGLSRGEAARRADWPRSLVKVIESGTHHAPVELCLRMWKVLGLELPEGWEALE